MTALNQLWGGVGSAESSPFNKVTQEIKGMDCLLFVFVEWQPGKPMGEDLVDVGTLWPVPHDLADSGDAVLSSVDVLLHFGIRCLDHPDQQWDCL